MVSDGPSQTSGPLDPRELYQSCLKNEHELHRKGFYGLKAEFLSMIAFGVLLPINLESAEKYRLLLRSSAKAANDDARLRVIASWLKQEGVCQPHEFLPKCDFLVFLPRLRACCAESNLPSYAMPTLWKIGAHILTR